jgi:hypothetical protein
VAITVVGLLVLAARQKFQFLKSTLSLHAEIVHVESFEGNSVFIFARNIL